MRETGRNGHGFVGPVKFFPIGTQPIGNIGQRVGHRHSAAVLRARNIAQHRIDQSAIGLFAPPRRGHGFVQCGMGGHIHIEKLCRADE